MKRKELLNALAIVKPGLANKELIEQATSFAFMDGNVVTYNDEISISHPIEGLDVTGAVHADELHKFLAKSKAEEIDVTVNENEMQIKAGRSKVGLALQQEIRLPVQEIGNKGKWKPLPDDFVKAIKFALFSCSTDLSRPILTCLNIRKDGIIESSDAFRLTRFNISDMPIPTFLLPQTSARILINYPITQIAKGTSWIHFRTEENTILSCRMMEDDFPNADSLVQVEGKQIKFPKDTIEILSKAIVFAKRDAFENETVEVIFSKSELTIKSKSHTGWFEESTKAKYGDDRVSFSVNPNFLSDILKETRTCILGDDKRKIKFETDNWMHMAALIRPIKRTKK